MTSTFPSRQSTRSRLTSTLARQARPQLETLESRLVLYSVSGNAWANPELITISFMPDGTSVNGQSSNLFATFNAKFGSPSVWQNQILKAAQQWAIQTNINFALVSDDGSASGSGSYQQGAGNFGDIRIGGYNIGGGVLGQAYLPPPVNNYSVAGDIQFNTAQTFNIGSTYDLYTVAMHEFGHALGLYHGAAGSVMTGTYASAMSALATDDVNGVRNIYSSNLARAKDAYDNAASNNTSATATTITSAINVVTKAGIVEDMDLTTSTDVDWYKFTVPVGSSNVLTVRAKSQSLLNPRIDVYDSALVLKASGNAGAYGGTATATFSGLVAGQTYYVKVSSTDPIAAFKVGRYGLILNMGIGADPELPLPATQTANGSPLSSGGGQADAVLVMDAVANTTTAGVQQTGAQRAVASTIGGDYVVAWSSYGQDGSGWGIYARRFNSTGAPVSDEFLVNTTTAGDQVTPSVAIDGFNRFTIAWASEGQDGSGWGIYARRYDVVGNPVGGEFRVNATTAGDQTAPAVAMDVGFNTVITWTSSGQDGSGQGIYAQRFYLGYLPMGEFRVNTTTTGDQTASTVAFHRNAQEFVISWVSQDGSGLGIYAQRYNWLGLPQGGEFRVNATTAGDQVTPALAMNWTTGDFVVVWASWNQDGSGWGVYGQRYNGLGETVGGEFQINATTAGDQFAPSAVMDSVGNLLVTWTSAGQDGSGTGIYGQLITPLNEAHEGEFRVNVITEGDQQFASVSQSQLGRAVVVWSGFSTEDDSGVFYQLYDLTQDAYYAEGHDHGHDHGSEGEEHPCACASCEGLSSTALVSAGIPGESGGVGISSSFFRLPVELFHVEKPGAAPEDGDAFAEDFRSVGDEALRSLWAAGGRRGRRLGGSFGQMEELADAVFVGSAGAGEET